MLTLKLELISPSVDCATAPVVPALPVAVGCRSFVPSRPHDSDSLRQTLGRETDLSARGRFPHAMVELDPPTERECRQCGRRDVWDSDATSWRIESDARVGNAYCIHEWDINGTYRPIRE